MKTDGIAPFFSDGVVMKRYFSLLVTVFSLTAQPLRYCFSLRCLLNYWCISLMPLLLCAQPPTPVGGFPQANDRVRAFAQDGTYMYIGGEFTAVGTPANPLIYTNLAKCTATNSLPDPNVSVPQGTVKVIVSDGAGGFFVGGQFNSVVPGPARNRIFHLLANGTVDPAWSAGTISTDVFALAFDGTSLYVGGAFVTIGGQTRNRIAKLSGATGAVDLAWDANLTASTRVMAIVLNGSDVYIGGQFTAVNGQTRNNIAKVEATTGALDMAWDPNVNNTVETLALDAGLLYIGGGFSTISGTLRSNIGRVNAVTGALDMVWNPGANGTVYVITPDAAGIYVGGNFGICGIQMRWRIARVSASGAGGADTWNPGNDPVSNLINTVFAIRIFGGSVYVGGDFRRMGGEFINHGAKLDPVTGNADAAWQPNRLSQVEDIAIDGAGNMLLGGGFSANSVGGYGRNFVARIDKATKALDLSWKPYIVGSLVRSLLVNGTDIYVGGFFNRVNSTLMNHLVKLSTISGALDPAWNPLGANSDVHCMASDGANLFLGGNFTNIGGVGRGRLAKLALANPGTVDATWNPNANNIVHAIQFDGAGNLYAGGDFTIMIGGQSRNRLAKLSTSGAGAADAIWDPSPSSTVYSLLLSGLDLFVGGNFTMISGQARSRIAKLTTTGVGAADAGWVVNAGGLVFAMYQNGVDLYVGGNFSVFAAQPRNRLAKVSAASGALDMMWNPSANNDVNEFAYDGTNQWLYSGGLFTTLNAGAVTNRCLTVLPITAAPSFTYYYESGDPNLPISWGTQAGAGLGTAATNFTNIGDLFVLENGAVTAPATGNISLGTGVTMQVNGVLKMGAFALTGGGNLQLNAVGTLSTSRTDGINGTSALTGMVQLSGTISYNASAGYEFVASAGSISTNFAANGVKPAIVQMGNCTVIGPNLTTLDHAATIDGAFMVNSGTFSTGAFTLTLGAIATGSVMNTARVRIPTGGSMLFANSLAGSFTVQNGGTLEVNGSGQVQPASASAVGYAVGSTLEYAGATPKIANDKEIGAAGVQRLVVSNTAETRLGAGMSVNVHQELNVANACLLRLDNTGNPSLTVNGVFNLNLAGALASANGVNSGSLGIMGSGAVILRMAAGDETLLNFTLNRSGTHTLSTDLNVRGILNLQQGALVPTTSVFSGDPVGATVGVVATGGQGYVQGKLQRRLAGGITMNGTHYFFPVGTPSGSRALTLNDAQTGISPVVEAEVSDPGAMTADMTTITRLSSARNWHLQVVSGVFNGSALTLTESGLTGSSLIGRSVMQSGTYSSVGGSSVTTTIASNPASVPANVNHFFAVGVIAPTITNVSPLSVSAGDTLVIDGANLAGVSAVGIGGFPAASFVILSSTRIRAVLGEGGTGIVSLVSEVGVSLSAQVVTFLNNPVIDTFSPSVGTTGSTITIRGARLSTAQRVSFGGIPAQRFTVLDANTILAAVDNGQTGVVGVQTLSGSAVSLANFTFDRTPSIVRFTPAWAKIGDTVQIYGGNFLSASKVRFGSVEAASTFRIVTSGQITVQVPNTGTARISIENSVGADTSQQVFTVVSAPRIDNASPLQLGLGAALTIEGAEFHPLPQVRIGLVTASTVAWEGLNRIVARFSTTASGALTVGASGGTVTLAQPFAVFVAPRIFSIAPSSPSPGDVVIVTGANFVTGATTVRIGDTFVPVSVNSSGQLTFVVPSALTGNITLTTPGGTLQNTVASFSVVPAPRILSLSATVATVGQSIEVIGRNFLNMSAVRIAESTSAFVALGSTGERLRVVVPMIAGLDTSSAAIISSDATLSVETRSGIATVPILLTNRPVSTNAVISTQAVMSTSQVMIRLTGISPLTIVEGNMVRLEGENIPTTASVYMNNVLLRTITVESSTAIVCRVPIGTVPVDADAVMVRFSVSTATQTLPAPAPVSAPALVRVEAANRPALFGFYPPRGTAQTVLSIVGENFSTIQIASEQGLMRGLVRNVRIGGIPVLAWRVLSPTLIVATIGTVQSGLVVVETASGVMQSATAFLLDTTGESAMNQDFGSVVSKDSLALNRFFAATSGIQWTTSMNWKNTAPIALRFGVRVQNRRVVELRLPNNNLAGLLPPDVLQDLDALRVLDLSNNALAGTIPQELVKATNLDTIRLAGNQLSGALPQGLCALTRLRELDLSNNILQDSLASLCCLQNVTILNLRGNKFTGTFPACIGNMTSMGVLDLSRNAIAGTVPDAIGLLTQLQRLNLRGNRLTGRFPAALGGSRGKTTAKTSAKTTEAVGLETLDVGENSFTGSIPDEIGNLSSVRTLLFDHNQFSGALPKTLLSIMGLRRLDVSWNELSDAPDLAVIPRLDTLAVEHNRFEIGVLERFLRKRGITTYMPQAFATPRIIANGNATSSVITVLVNEPLRLSVVKTGLFNRTAWKRNGALLTNTDTSIYADFRLSAFALRDTGVYECVITNTQLTEISLTTAQVRVLGRLPDIVASAVQIIAPKVGEEDVALTPDFAWTSSLGTSEYRMELASDSTFTTVITSATISQSAEILASGRVLVDKQANMRLFPNSFPLAADRRFAWRVRAENAVGASDWAVGTFTTAAPDVQVTIVPADLGKVTRHDTARGTLVLRNLGAGALTIESIQADNTAFLVDDVPSTVLSGAEARIPVRFVARTVGNSSSAVTVRFRSGMSTTQQSRTFANRLAVRVSGVKFIAPRFDTVIAGRTRISSAMLINVDDKPITLQSTTLRQKVEQYTFRFTSQEEIVQPGDTLVLPIGCLAAKAGDVPRDTVRCISYNGAVEQLRREDLDTAQVELKAFARVQLPTDVPLRIAVKALDSNVSPGGSVRLEIALVSAGNLDSVFKAATPTLRGRLRWNEQVLALDRSETGVRRMNGASRSADGFQRFTIPTTNWLGRSQTLLQVRCVVVAGSTAATAITLEELEWGAGNVLVDSLVDGSFTAKLSRAGGVRLISPTPTAVKLTAIAPNPAKDVMDIHYSLGGEGGFVDIVLMDARGNVVQNLKQEVQRAGEYSLIAKVGWLASGSYTVRLRVNGEMETQQVQIVR